MAHRPVVVRWASVEHGPTADPRLPAEARERLAALRDDADRRRFVGVRRLLTRLVTEVTGVDTDGVELHQRCPRCGGPHGRPHVRVHGRPGPEVSLAHGGAVVVAALAATPVGVDVEPITATPVDGDTLVDWVRREAVLKALDLGIDVEPIPFRLGPSDEPPRLVGWSGPGRRPSVRLADLALHDTCVAAVARTGRARLRLDVARVDLDR